MRIQSHEDLKVWQAAMDVCEACYRLTADFPNEERYGLTSQLRRASVSIPSNIAEGYGRENTGDYIRFLKIAQGSLREVETQLALSRRLRIANIDECNSVQSRCNEVSKMLRALIRSLQNP